MESSKGPRPRRWLRAWVREEVFWRDVTTRTISGLLVVAITFLAGLAGGYFETPDGRSAALSALGVILGAGLLVGGYAWVFNGDSDDLDAAATDRLIFRRMILMLIVFGVVGIGWVVVIGLARRS